MAIQQELILSNIIYVGADHVAWACKARSRENRMFGANRKTVLAVAMAGDGKTAKNIIGTILHDQPGASVRAIPPGDLQAVDSERGITDPHPRRR